METSHIHLSDSVLKDVLKGTGGKKKANSMLRQWELEKKMEQEKKVEEIKLNFKGIFKEKFLIQKLKENKWDVDNAILFLLQLKAKIDETKKKEKIVKKQPIVPVFQKKPLKKKSDVTAAVKVMKKQPKPVLKKVMKKQPKPVLKKQPKPVLKKVVKKQPKPVLKKIEKVPKVEKKTIAEPKFAIVVSKKTTIEPKFAMVVPKKKPDDFFPIEEGEDIIDETTLDKTMNNLPLKISFTPLVNDINETITVLFINQTPENRNSWIGLFRTEEKNNTNYLAYQYVCGKKKITFMTPSEYGHYEFRYFTKTSEKTTNSSVFYVGPKLEISTATTTTEEPSKILKINMHYFSGHLENCWFGIYRKNATIKNYTYFQYIRPLEKGINYFSGIRPIIPGEYEIRVYNQGYKFVKSSKIFQIKGVNTMRVIKTQRHLQILVHLVTVDPTVESVWFGIYKKGATNYLSYGYIKKLGPSLLVSDFSLENGKEYEVKLVSGKNNVLCCVGLIN